MNGGPAFPKLSQDTRWKTFTSTDGMTLRDYFAAKAVQGFLNNFAIRNVYIPPDDELAKSAYDLADAMLKARGDA